MIYKAPKSELTESGRVCNVNVVHISQTVDTVIQISSGVARGGVWGVQTPPLRNVNFLLLITEQKQWLSVTEILKKYLKLLPPDVIFLILKCTKFDFGWGSAPDPAGAAHSAPPDPLAGFKGSYF